MTNDETDRHVTSRSAEPGLEERIGLCARCCQVRIQSTKRGSRFYRCALADENDAYLRYPPLPVRQCDGFEPETR